MSTQREKREHRESDDRSVLTSQIIAAAIEVHRHLGAGLLESTYESALVHECGLRGMTVQSQLLLPVVYKGLEIAGALRIDMVVNGHVIVEIKACERLLSVHRAQLLTYLRLSGLHLGLLLNFNVKVLREGIVRVTTLDQ